MYSRLKEEAYFFKMSKYADRLIEHINTHPEFIQPVSRKNEMMNNFLLARTYRICAYPEHPSHGEFRLTLIPKHVVYVWLDALTNYITGIGYDCDGEQHTSSVQEKLACRFTFDRKGHYPFPHNLLANLPDGTGSSTSETGISDIHGFLQGDGKMSKSKGNVIVCG